MKRAATVYVKGIPAAVITEHAPAGSEGAYTLQYLPEYLELPARQAGPVSLRLPRRAEPYVSDHLFPYLESILPEGEFARNVAREWGMDPRDRFGLLLVLAGTDTLGDVTVKPRSTTES
ncbi:MAG: HipA N-terminal domain-containing protein [Akkermansia sp.]|nr:HipA N-terminal domain-containing protein [Akkermansia sp.]